MGYIAEQKLPAAIDGRIRPFVLNRSGCLPGEGALFFLLGMEKPENGYCAVDSVNVGDEPEKTGTPDLNIIDADGMLPDETAYLSSLDPAIPVAAYSPIFGSMMVGGAFNLAVAALMLKKQFLYASPVPDNPHGLNILSQTAPMDISSIRCIGCNCYGEKSNIYVSRVQGPVARVL